MATATVRQIVVSAMGALGIGVGGEPVDEEDVYLGLEHFNDFIDGLKAVRLGTFELRRTAFALSSNTASYAIGPGAVWDIGAAGTRPEAIVRAGFVDSNGYETPIRIYTDEEWADTALKSQTNTQVYAIWFQTGVPNGTIWVVPILNGATGSIALYLPYPLNEVAEDENGLAATIVVPPMWRRMLKNNLAIEMADDFNIVPSAALIKKANDSMRAVQKANIKPALLQLPAALLRRRGGYNIRTNW